MKKNLNQKLAIKTLLPFLWPKNQTEIKLRVIFALLALFVATAVQTYAPITLGLLVDHLNLGAKNIEIGLAIALLLAYAGARILEIIFQEIREVLFVKVSYSSMRSIAVKVFSHLHHLPHDFHLNYHSGGVARVIDRGIKGIDFLLSFMLFNIAPTILKINLVSIILWSLFDIFYALVAFTSVSSYIIFTLAMTEWRLKFRRQMNEQDTKASAASIDSLVNFETVKYFNHEEHETKRYDSYMEQYMFAGIRSIKSLSLLNIGQATIISLGLFILLFMAVQDFTKGLISLGDFVLINTYLLQLYIPLGFLGFVYREIRRSLTDMEEMFQLSHVSSAISSNSNSPALDATKSSIEFKNVTFGYTEDKVILKNISFTLEHGQKLAIVGTSGSGKTTISRLLFRFYDIDHGTILINNQDISKVSLHSLRSMIGIVPQDTVLFNDTIEYNIVYGCQNTVTKEDVIQVAKTASIHDFIMSLDKQYDTIVGERGLKLSGGEKQRVAISRALLKNTPIIIFDEATSALDTNTEREVQKSLDNLAEDKTTIIIAHRLSTITQADKILVFDEGKLKEQGTHQELLAQEGLYKNLWLSQQDRNVK